MAAPPRKALLEVMPHLAELSFPLDEARLLEIVTAIKEVPGLPSVPRQELPRLPPSMSLVDRHKRVQQFIEAFEYNFTGENFFNVRGVRQNQSLFRVLELAKRVIREALPIKCVEAVYLGIYLTQSMQDIERVPIIFNSEIGGHRYGHIVLLLRYNGRLGAVGLSRRPDLMFKPWGFESLSDIVAEFKRSYERWSHKLLKIKIGTRIPHEGSQKLSEVVDWANTVISLAGQEWDATDAALRKKARTFGWEARDVSVPPGLRGAGGSKGHKQQSSSTEASPTKKPSAAEQVDAEEQELGSDSGGAGAGAGAGERHSFLGV